MFSPIVRFIQSDSSSLKKECVLRLRSRSSSWHSPVVVETEPSIVGRSRKNTVVTLDVAWYDLASNFSDGG